MARKDRAPNPPKRPQAPQRRSTPTDPATAARQRRLLYLIAGSGLAALAVVLAIVFLFGGDDGGERAALEKAGCTLEIKPGLAGDHNVAIGATTKKWNTNPPTSGPHNPLPAVWGSYEDPVPLAQSVHNLEHGGIVIHYGPDVPEADVTAIRTFYNDDPNGMLVAPLPSLGDKIALSAWTAPDETNLDETEGFLAECPRFDEDAFSAFRDEHRFEGPERFPPESLTPGS
jgi:hypothetical protein